MSNEESSTPAVNEAKKGNSWGMLWFAIASTVIVKLFGVAGGLITIGAYYLLKPKLGTWGAVGVAGVIGVVAVIAFGAMLRTGGLLK